jgi:hypothetical protein
MTTSSFTYKAADHGGSRLGAMTAMLGDRYAYTMQGYHTAFVWSSQEGEYLLMVKPKGVFIDTRV